MDSDEIRRRIIEYVHEHPNAADSAEGIAQWWLGAEARHVADAEVQGVAEDLVAEGRLLKRTRSDSSAMYFANPSKLPP